MEQGVVVFDDRCGFCQRSVRLLRALDGGGVYRYVGSSNEGVLRELGISQAEADEELKLALRGRVFGGYDAVVEALRGLPAGSWIAPLMGLGPLRWAGRRIYRGVASRRKCGWQNR